MRNFTEMIQQQYRSLFPSGQAVDASTLVSSAGQQSLINNLYAAAALAGTGATGDTANLDAAGNALELPTPEDVSKPESAEGTPTTDGSPSPPSVVCCPQAANKMAGAKPKHPSKARSAALPATNLSANAASIAKQKLKVYFICLYFLF